MEEILNVFFHYNQEETLIYIFEYCQPIKQKLNNITNMKLAYIYGTLSEQIEAISVFEKITDMRKLVQNNIIRGGSAARTLALL